MPNAGGSTTFGTDVRSLKNMKNSSSENISNKNSVECSEEGEKISLEIKKNDSVISKKPISKGGIPQRKVYDRKLTSVLGKQSPSITETRSGKTPTNKTQRTKASTALKVKDSSSQQKIRTYSLTETSPKDNGSRTRSRSRAKDEEKNGSEVKGYNAKEKNALDTKNNEGTFEAKGRTHKGQNTVEEKRSTTKQSGASVSSQQQASTQSKPDTKALPPGTENNGKEREILGYNLSVMSSPACSFFERIQQGVKAYFSSRSSFRNLSSADEKNKTKPSKGGIGLG